jgi:hypothetical protein
VKPPRGRHGPASLLPLVNGAAAADDQVSAFPDEGGDGDPSPSGKVFQQPHLGLGELDLGADHGFLPGITDTTFATMITLRYETGKKSTSAAPWQGKDCDARKSTWANAGPHTETAKTHNL